MVYTPLIGYNTDRGLGSVISPGPLGVVNRPKVNGDALLRGDLVFQNSSDVWVKTALLGAEKPPYGIVVVDALAGTDYVSVIVKGGRAVAKAGGAINPYKRGKPGVTAGNEGQIEAFVETGGTPDSADLAAVLFVGHANQPDGDGFNPVTDAADGDNIIVEVLQ